MQAFKTKQNISYIYISYYNKSVKIPESRQALRLNRLDTVNQRRQMRFLSNFAFALPFRTYRVHLNKLTSNHSHLDTIVGLLTSFCLQATRMEIEDVFKNVFTQDCLNSF